MARRDLYVLPNFTDEASLARSKAIALGRATGGNGYAPASAVEEVA